MSQGKVAVILLLEDSQEARSSNQSAVDSEGSEGMNCLLVEALMSDSQQLVKVICCDTVKFNKLFVSLGGYIEDFQYAELFSRCDYLYTVDIQNAMSICI